MYISRFSARLTFYGSLFPPHFSLSFGRSLVHSLVAIAVALLLVSNKFVHRSLNEITHVIDSRKPACGGGVV